MSDAPPHNRRATDLGSYGGDVRPVPDPTKLTTEQLNREIAALREAVGHGQLALREILETRMDGNDRAIELLQAATDKLPAWIDQKIVALRDVHDQKFVSIVDSTAEKFSSIQTQFTERDVRTEQAAGAVKIAVDAALQAQKEAVGEQNKSSSTAISKSEQATVKQIDQLSVLIQTMTKAFDDKIGDVKDRLTRIEGKDSATDPQSQALIAEVHANTARLSASAGQTTGLEKGWGYLVAIVGVALALYFGNRAAVIAPVPAPAPVVIVSPQGTVLPTAAQPTTGHP
jgi:hypothetical protein